MIFWDLLHGKAWNSPEICFCYLDWNPERSGGLSHCRSTVFVLLLAPSSLLLLLQVLLLFNNSFVTDIIISLVSITIGISIMCHDVFNHLTASDGMVSLRQLGSVFRFADCISRELWPSYQRLIVRWLLCVYSTEDKWLNSDVVHHWLDAVETSRLRLACLCSTATAHI